jgi:hypothetical protein
MSMIRQSTHLRIFLFCTVDSVAARVAHLPLTCEVGRVCGGNEGWWRVWGWGWGEDG